MYRNSGGRSRVLHKDLAAAAMMPAPSAAAQDMALTKSRTQFFDAVAIKELRKRSHSEIQVSSDPDHSENHFSSEPDQDDDGGGKPSAVTKIITSASIDSNMITGPELINTQ
jgi:hypothetical protein